MGPNLALELLQWFERFVPHEGFVNVSFMNVLSICAIVSFPFGFKDGMQDLIVLIPDQCLSIYFF